MMEIAEKEVYDRIKADLEKLPEDKWKELWYHIQGILISNALAHKHGAEAVEHLADASQLLSTPGIVTLAKTSGRSTFADYGEFCR